MMTKLKVRVTPNARSNQLVGVSEDEVRIKIQSPAQDGKANAALIRFLAELIDCKPSQIRIVIGEKARTKIIEIKEADPTAVWKKLLSKD